MRRIVLGLPPEPARPKSAHDIAEAQGYLTHAEVDFLRTLAAGLPGPAIIVNLGAGAGTSTIAFREGNLGGTVFSVDSRLAEAGEFTSEHLRLTETEPVIASGVIRIWGDTAAVGRAWPWPVDMVFFDAEHVKAGLTAEMFAWLPHIRFEGIAAFHDYGKSLWPDIAPLLDEWYKAYSFNLEPIDVVDTTCAFRVLGDVA